MKEKITIDRMREGVLDVISSDEEQYHEFLAYCSRGNLNRFSFGSQLVLYWQKPQASVVAGLHIWNQTGNRILRGKHGAHIYPEPHMMYRGKPELVVFDIQDTERSRNVELWEIKNGDHEAIALELTGGTEHSLLKAIQDMAVSHLRDIIRNDSSEKFEAYTGLYQDFICDSITEELALRSGLMGETGFRGNFSKVFQIDKQERMAFMKAAGEYTASIAKAVAVQIRSAVKRHTEKERGKGNGGQQREQDRNAGRYPDHLKKQDNELRIDETGLSRFDRGRDLSGDTEGRRGRDPHESIGEGRAESSRNRDADTQVVHGRTSEGSIGGIHEVSPVELPGRGDRKGNSDTRSGGNTAEPFPVREPQEKTEVLPVQEAFAEDFYYDLYGEDEYSARSGSKTRYRDNVTAIRLLKQLEKENRAALPKEQLLLSRYAGWGGIPQVFDENNSSWKKEYQELREVLTDSEYQAARASTLSAFYTDPELSGAIWQKLLDMGFEGGNVLEPSMGIGNFYSSMPEELRGQVKKYGVELDSISGRIAKKLHPSAHIEICGYEESDFGDNQFDVVIGNVPFGDFKVYDPKHRKENFSIHNYFFAKALDSVRAGGIVAFLTSTGTLDAVDDKARQYIAERAELLGAVRLPTRVFRDTETACDAVFLQKRESRSYQKADWTAAEPVLVSTQSGELLGHLENSPVLTMLSEWKCQIILESLMKQNGGDVLSLASDLYLERTDTGVAQRIIEDHFSKEYYRQLQASMLTDFMDYDYDRAVAYMQERCGRNPAYEGILTEMKKHPISGVTATMPNMQRILQFCGSSYDAKRFLGDIAESKYGRLRRNLHKELFMRLTGEDGRKTPEMTAYFEDKDEMTVNRYFNDHPEQILGKMVYQEGRFGGDSRYATCVNDAEEFDVRQEFLQAASGINGIYMSAILPDDRNVSEGILPAPADQKNFTFCVVNGNVYYKQDSVLIPCNKKTEKELDRIRSLLLVKKAVKNTLAVQLENCTDEVYEESRKILNQRYDEFFDMEKRRILDSVMEKAMHDDVEFPLLCALEQRMDDGTIQKADIFFRRTIHARENLIHAEDPMDALNISINRLNRVDLVYMGHLLDEMPYKDITEKLEGMIFLNPAHYLAEDYTAGWETAEEYLSGNVRDKLRVAELYAEKYPELFHGNVEALKDAQPKWLDASQIEVRLGTPWIDTEDYRKFLIETVPMTDFVKSKVKVEHDTADNSFLISNAEDLRFSEAATTVYGTKRLHVAEIMERVLNMRDIEVKDKVYDPVKEKDVYQVNAEETALAQAKAEQLKNLFKEWFWEDAERREKYVAYYNNTFNNTRLRRYDGSMLTFEGMNNEIALTSYQKDAVARILRGRNTLLSHCVGAGKTFEMQCGCMEMKRLGMISKALMVVPNHLTAQTASEFMKLYPSANILLTRKRDFEKKNRRIFISKIATGDYDCVIMGASQFEKISMSPEYEKTMLEKQIEETKEMLREIERTEEKSFSVKQIQKKLKQLEERSRRLINAPVRDDVIYFENLGIDCLIVDEAHDFKNLGIATKMTRVAGVPQQSSQKAFDLYMKKCYVEEHGGKIVFATGTPISNTMAEMYVMMKYLYEKEMNDMGIYCFDSWAACFGEIVPMLELKVAGDGYRTNNRFAKFSNVPELMSMFRSFTDVVLPDMINLPVPKLKNGTYTIVEAEPSQAVLEKMEEFVNRSEAIHNGTVNPQEDNMLKISGEARLLGTDIRLLDPYAPGYDGCKLDLAVDNICRKYQEFDVEKGTQIVFSDIGTPGSNRFNVYDYIREECIKRGIPEDEIAFIHNADTEKKKEELFAKMKAGTVRILIGSTSKMGTGMNVQDRVCAIHEIDIPWRPADVEQREGRGLRQGNRFEEVEVFRYITKRTFDAYSYQMLERKQNFISQIMSEGALENRACEDIDDKAISYSEIKSIASGNPLVEEKFKIDAEVAKLTLLKRQHLQNHYRMQDEYKAIPGQIEQLTLQIQKVSEDAASKQRMEEMGEQSCITLQGKTYELNGVTQPEEYYRKQRKAAGEKLLACAAMINESNRKQKGIGTYGPFSLSVKAAQDATDYNHAKKYLVLQGKGIYSIELGNDPSGNLVRFSNRFASLGEELPDLKMQLERKKENLSVLAKEVDKPFEKEEELQKLIERQSELNVQLSETATMQKEEPKYLEPKFSQEEGLEKSDSGIEEEKIRVAVETSADYSEPDIGFHTYSYLDGREKMCYRLVTIGKDGYLAAYPEVNSFFDSYELLQKYLKDNEDKLELSNYDSMVHESAKISHKYRLLSRLQSDCEHYLSEGERNAKHLYADTEQEQIQLMQEIYQSFSEKERPEWISIEDINRYADQMLPSGQMEEPAENKGSLEKWQETLHETEIKEIPHDYGTYQYRKKGRTK